MWVYIYICVLYITYKYTNTYKQIYIYMTITNIYITYKCTNIYTTRDIYNIYIYSIKHVITNNKQRDIHDDINKQDTYIYITYKYTYM